MQLLDRDLRRALAYIAPHWRRLTVVLLLSLVSTVLSLYIPYLARLLIDRALIGGDSSVLVRVILQFAALTARQLRAQRRQWVDLHADVGEHLVRHAARTLSPAATTLAALLRRDAGRTDRHATQRRHR